MNAPIGVWYVVCAVAAVLLGFAIAVSANPGLRVTAGVIGAVLMIVGVWNRRLANRDTGRGGYTNS
jgi:hypothetical protein